MQELLPEPDMFGQRARSASDASVLRRKGHLKEQDQMIEFLLQMHVTHTSMETMVKMERWIEHHRRVCTAPMHQPLAFGSLPLTCRPKHTCMGSLPSLPSVGMDAVSC